MTQIKERRQGLYGHLLLAANIITASAISVSFIRLIVMTNMAKVATHIAAADNYMSGIMTGIGVSFVMISALEILSAIFRRKCYVSGILSKEGSQILSTMKMLLILPTISIILSAYSVSILVGTIFIDIRNHYGCRISQLIKRRN